MTVEWAIGKRCALKSCRGKFREDEGVGFFYKGRLVWMHSDCARRFRKRQQGKRRKRREETVAARGPR